VGPQELLPTGAGLVLEHIQLCDEVVHLFVRPSTAGASCPICTVWSEAFHSSYERCIADLPIADRQGVVHLAVRRFRCHEPTCPRQTFVEQVPKLVERYGRRTRRLRSDLEFIGLALGGRAGSRLCGRQKKPTGRTTLLRLVRALPEPPTSTPRELGVDEFAFRRGRRYGTILVDADSHRVIDLLEDPSADALVNWLDEHPGVKVICRDRDGVYASAATRGTPDAMQVADRWHIVHNLAAALERMAVRVLAPLHKQTATDHMAKLEKQRTAANLPTQGRIDLRNERRHAEIHALHDKGLTITAIADQLHLNRRTVRKFLDVHSADELRRTLGVGPSRLDRFAPYLVRRWQEGCQVAAYLHAELRALGYRGSKRTVRRFVEDWRRSQPPPPVRRVLPGPQTLCWMLLRRRSELDDAERLLLGDLCQQSSELAESRRLAQRFMVLVRERRAGQLDQWIAEVHNTGPPELRGFSRNLHRDWLAVHAGFTLHWSSGPVEGNINRLKLIKRQMFGRAKFDLLRKRVLLAS
jgi:transposase